MANAVLADAKFPWGSFACIITEYPIFIGLRISQIISMAATGIYAKVFRAVSAGMRATSILDTHVHHGL